MQLLLPIFPATTAYITTSLGVCRLDGIVTYIHCGVPIFSHKEEDHQAFRFISSKFVLQSLCRKVDIAECFHVSSDSVNRYVKKLERLGESGFFKERDNRKGSCYKLVPAVLERMQGYLDQGKSNSEIARLEEVTEGSVRYALRKGFLKKSL
jgi:DNA-binding CsgD family transcriptional regulator